MVNAKVRPWEVGKVLQRPLLAQTPNELFGDRAVEFDFDCLGAVEAAGQGQQIEKVRHLACHNLGHGHDQRPHVVERGAPAHACPYRTPGVYPESCRHQGGAV